MAASAAASQPAMATNKKPTKKKTTTRYRMNNNNNNNNDDANGKGKSNGQANISTRHKSYFMYENPFSRTQRGKRKWVWETFG
jgi:hypothetical protein